MTVMQALRFSLYLCFAMVFSPSVFSQGRINGPSVVCLGDVSAFTYTPPSGYTVSSLNWDFGDGFSSGNTSPSHIYAAKGKYKVRVQASFSNSSSGSDSLILDVFDLPKAFFYFLPASDTCFNQNLVCFRDTSSGAGSGQSITQRLIVWGDGSFQTYNNPVKGDSICHSYPVSAAYNVRMEVRDQKGCENSVSTKVNIVENITVDFSLKDTFVDCRTAQIFMRNRSFGTPDSNAHYRWLVDNLPVDSGFYFNGFKRINFTAGKSGTVTLIAYANNACRDTLSKPYTVVVDTLSNELILSDTILCNSSDFAIECNYPKVAMDSLCWYRDGAAPPVPGPLPKDFTWFWNNYRIGPGKHEIKINIFRGNCIHTVRKNFTLLGPLPSVRVIDGQQCVSNRQVFVVDESLSSVRERSVFRWRINDPDGDNCVHHQAKNLNLYKNCNVSEDWYIKHRFKDLKTFYNGRFWIKDTVSGCEDSTDFKIFMDYCSSILKPDTLHICRGSTFIENVTQPMPDAFTLDSGKNWMAFPSIIDTSLSGIFDIGFKFKTLVSPWAENFGTDSIRIHKDTAIYYDTLYRKQKLWIHDGIQDSVYIKVYGKCRPFRVSVFFKKGRFNANERLSILWSDHGNYDSLYPQQTQVDSVMHIYNRIGLNHEIRVIMENPYSCSTVLKFIVERGKALSMYTPKFMTCFGDQVCLTAGVYDFAQRKFWSGNTSNNKVSWYIPDENSSSNVFNYCHTFRSAGMQAFELRVSDSLGCRDTLFDTVFVQKPIAGVRKNALLIYCNDLKQFYDSSSFLINPKYHSFFPKYYRDSVKRYSWRFGNGVYNSFQKNPLQSINTALDSIPASHVIEMVSGCTDTVHFTIKVIGPKPYFSIRDTIGCGSLDAVFVNRSKNAAYYIWQFGDSAQTSLQTSSAQDQVFRYSKPGRYFIKLTAVDTVYNPFTNRRQVCVSHFPDPLFQKDTLRSVLVLPYRKTGIVAPDTVCRNRPFALLSLSDTAYTGDYWTISDSSIYDSTAPSRIIHRFLRDGIYTVKLVPYYSDSLADLCRDSALKTIVVMGVKADFDVDPLSLAPLFRFKNRSVPASSMLWWDFGQPGTDNNSTEQNPEKHYGTDTGYYNICLTASIPYGCADTVCKTIFNDYLNDFGIYNVFTPGKIDGLNDRYDIEIEGESLYDLRIFNRWGELVFESDADADNNGEGNWNGKLFNTGADCPAGTYYYLFKYRLRSKPDELKSIEGIIQLIR